MGCYPPLGKIVSKALGKCNGRERWRQERLDYLAYPPTEIHYMRPVARTVTFASNNSVYVIPPSPPQPQQQQQSPPEPQQPQTPPQSEPEQHQHHDAPHQSQPPQPEQPEQEPPAAPAQTQDAPPQAEPKPPKAPRRGGKKKQSGRVRFGPEPPPPQQQEQEQQEEEHGSGGGDAPGQQGPHHGAAPAPGPVQQGQQGYLLRYTPSPLPRWEATPRRHEYFSGEYRSYYPTPVREGIYRIATDANRLTTIFSEENPNACTIV